MTLLELLTAMILGLIVSAAALASFLGISQLIRTQRGMASVSDGSVTAGTYLASQMRQAGYLDYLEKDGQWSMLSPQAQSGMVVSSGDNSMLAIAYATAFPGLYAIHGCDGAYSAQTSLLNYNCSSSGNNLASSVSVAYQALSTPGGWTSPSLASLLNLNSPYGTDCGGRGTRSADNANASPAGDVALNRYYLDTATSRLMCVGNGNTAVPIQVAGNVEQFQMLYGLAQTGTSAVAQFVPASTVNTGLGWAKVIAVQLCLLSVGEPGSLAKNGSGNAFNLDCSGAPANVADGRLRRLHRVTFSLRNAVHSATPLP